MRKLIYQIAQSICLALEAPKPKVKRLVVSSFRIKAELDAMKLSSLYYGALLDHYQDYYYVESEDWGKIFDWIYFVYDMPPYMVAGMDCDGFAIFLMGLVQANFGLNSFGLVIGTTPAGGHAWNLFRTENGWLNLEPQTGKFFELGEKGYLPQHIFI